MREYIAGPMRGYPQYNFNAFETAAVRRRELGIDVVSPHELDIENGFVVAEWEPVFDCETHGGCRYFVNVVWIAAEQEGTEAAFQAAMRKDFLTLLGCDSIYMLDGWQRSQGARMEWAFASWIGLEINYQSAPSNFDIYDAADMIASGLEEAVHAVR